MDERDQKEQTNGNIMIIERRSNKERELSSAEVMRLVRKRSTLKMKRRPGSGTDQDSK